MVNANNQQTRVKRGCINCFLQSHEIKSLYYHLSSTILELDHFNTNTHILHVSKKQEATNSRITEENVTFKFDETCSSSLWQNERDYYLIVSKNFNMCCSMEGFSMNFAHPKKFCIHACTSSLKPAQVYFFDPT